MARNDATHNLCERARSLPSAALPVGVETRPLPGPVARRHRPLRLTGAAGEVQLPRPQAARRHERAGVDLLPPMRLRALHNGARLPAADGQPPPGLAGFRRDGPRGDRRRRSPAANNATAMFTFYPQMKALWAFCAGLTVVAAGTCLVTLNLMLTHLAWRRRTPAAACSATLWRGRRSCLCPHRWSFATSTPTRASSRAGSLCKPSSHPRRSFRPCRSPSTWWRSWRTAPWGVPPLGRAGARHADLRLRPHRRAEQRLAQHEPAVAQQHVHRRALPPRGRDGRQPVVHRHPVLAGAGSDWAGPVEPPPCPGSGVADVEHGNR